MTRIREKNNVSIFSKFEEGLKNEIFFSPHLSHQLLKTISHFNLFCVWTMTLLYHFFLSLSGLFVSLSIH